LALACLILLFRSILYEQVKELTGKDIARPEE
jgi:hypothetical protein